MKLSDAILLGSANHKQCTGTYVQKNTDGSFSVCALGAASSILETINRDEFDVPWISRKVIERADALEKEYPFLCKQIVLPPVKKLNIYNCSNLGQAIVYINDDLRCSLAEIAEYVARVEREYPEWYAGTENSQNTIETECPSGVLSTA